MNNKCRGKVFLSCCLCSFLMVTGCQSNTPSTQEEGASPGSSLTKKSSGGSDLTHSLSTGKAKFDTLLSGSQKKTAKGKSAVAAAARDPFGSGEAISSVSTGGMPAKGSRSGGVSNNSSQQTSAGKGTNIPSGSKDEWEKKTRAELEARGKELIEEIDGHREFVEDQVKNWRKTRGDFEEIRKYEKKFRDTFGIRVKGATPDAYGFSEDEIKLLYTLCEGLPRSFLSGLKGLNADIDTTPRATMGVRVEDGNCSLNGIRVGNAAREGSVNDGRPGEVLIRHSASTMGLENFLRTAIHEMAHSYSFTAGSDGTYANWPKMDAWVKDMGWPADAKLGKTNWDACIPAERRKNLEPPVRAYGKTNAREDFATAVEMFLYNPQEMRSRFPKRYAWVKKNIMGGRDLPTLDQLSESFKRKF